MRSLQPKTKLRRLWIAIGGLAGVVALALGLTQIVQTGILSQGDAAVASTQVALQIEQNLVLKEIATLQAVNIVSDPTATAVAEQIVALEVTKEALADAIVAVEQTRAVIPEESDEPIIIPTRFEIVTSGDFPVASPSDAEIISFRDSNWNWVPGVSESSNRRIEENGTLTLITGPSTDFWNARINAPYIEKEISGNFQVQVSLDFNPTERYQIAGIGLRSTEDPADWIRIARGSSGGNGQYIDVAQTLNNRSEAFLSVPYGKTMAYLKIIRRDESLTFSASENGINWVDLSTDYVFSMPDKVQLFLFVYSTSGNGTLARFSDLQLASPQSRQSYGANQNVLFTSGLSTDILNEDGGWYPGSSPSSDFQQKNNSLTIISGPGTNLWDASNTSPRVEFLTTGDLVAQIRLDFAPSERFQAAGIGFRSTTDWRDWVYFRRTSSGGDNQTLDVVRTLDNDSRNVVSVPFAGNTVYLRIVRAEPLLSFYFSTDGKEWEPMVEEYVMGFPAEAWLFFSVYSTSGNGIQATFSDFSLSTQ